jgi:hypothetical protein
MLFIVKTLPVYHALEKLQKGVFPTVSILYTRPPYTAHTDHYYTTLPRLHFPHHEALFLLLFAISIFFLLSHNFPLLSIPNIFLIIIFFYKNAATCSPSADH